MIMYLLSIYCINKNVCNFFHVFLYHKYVRHLFGLMQESDDLVILGVTFDSTMTFEKHLRSVYEQLLKDLVY